MIGCFSHSIIIVGWFAELWITVNPTVGTSVLTRKYVREFGPVTVESMIVGLNEVNRKGMKVGVAFWLGYGRAPYSEGCGRLPEEPELGFAAFVHPP